MEAVIPEYQGVEEWKKVPGHEMYEASSHGRIRSWELRGKWQTERKEPAMKKLLMTRQKYHITGIKIGKGICKPRYVHRLVCMAFHGPCPDGMTASHIDGNSLNNSPDNLCWEPMLANVRRKRGHGTQYHGEEHGRTKLTQVQVEEIRMLRSQRINRGCHCGELSLRNIGKKYGIHFEQVRRICEGGSWDWLERNPF